jgi:hypothetical protein
MPLTYGTPTSLKGPPGNPGVAGSQIYFGNGTPDSTLGVAGDAFFAQDTSYIYQKTSSGWPAQGVLLRGAMGLTGVNGASLYAGPGSPNSYTFPKPPQDGDFYFDLVAGEVYVRQSGSWVDEGYSIKGPPGAAGVRGSRISVGSGAPGAAPSDAMAGDLYFDQTNGNLYAIQAS